MLQNATHIKKFSTVFLQEHFSIFDGDLEIPMWQNVPAGTHCTF
jgi:hypothetical protein